MDNLFLKCVFPQFFRDLARCSRKSSEAPPLEADDISLSRI